MIKILKNYEKVMNFKKENI